MPEVVQQGVDQQILKILKSNQGVLSLEEGYEGDIGDGIKRYRLFGEINEGTVAMNIHPTATPSVSVPVTFGEDVQLIIDTRDSVVIRSELKKE